MRNPQKARNRLLADWSRYLVDASHQGAFGRPIPIERIRAIPGPRAGALEIYAGMNSGRLLSALSSNDSATLRQFVPWAFAGEPAAFMAGRALRVEAGWPPGIAETMIRLADLGANPKGGGRWVTGKNERGQTIIAGLDDRTPHFLVSGSTGSGKSVALRGAVLQLARDPENQLVLLDGKFGESLRLVERLPGVVGPVAVDGPGMRSALGWAVREMRRRYESGDRRGRVVVVFDEFQEIVGDQVLVGLLSKLAAQGRAAGVHVICATQHPTVDSFGDKSTRRNLIGKLALLVDDPDASRVAVGGRSPRADWLLGQGDGYTVAPGSVHRIQGAYTDEQDVDAVLADNGRAGWQFDTFPEYDAGEIGGDVEPAGWSYSGNELAVALVSAVEQDGRPALKKRLESAGLGRPGSSRASRLLALGRQTYDALLGFEWDLCGVTD